MTPEGDWRSKLILVQHFCAYILLACNPLRLKDIMSHRLNMIHALVGRHSSSVVPPQPIYASFSLTLNKHFDCIASVHTKASDHKVTM